MLGASNDTTSTNNEEGEKNEKKKLAVLLWGYTWSKLHMQPSQGFNHCLGQTSNSDGVGEILASGTGVCSCFCIFSLCSLFSVATNVTVLSPRINKLCTLGFGLSEFD